MGSKTSICGFPLQIYLRCRQSKRFFPIRSPAAILSVNSTQRKSQPNRNLPFLHQKKKQLPPIKRFTNLPIFKNTYLYAIFLAFILLISQKSTTTFTNSYCILQHALLTTDIESYALIKLHCLFRDSRTKVRSRSFPRNKKRRTNA